MGHRVPIRLLWRFRDSTGDVHIAEIRDRIDSSGGIVRNVQGHGFLRRVCPYLLWETLRQRDGPGSFFGGLRVFSAFQLSLPRTV